MGYFILGAITVTLVSWMLIDVIQELCARVTRLEKENILLKHHIRVLEYKEDNQ